MAASRVVIPASLRFARLAIVVAWVALLIALAQSRLPDAGPAAAPRADGSPVRAATESEWSGLYMQGAKIGYANSRIAPRGDGYRLDETSVMRLSMLGQEQNVRAVIAADAGPDWAVKTFSVSLDSDLGRLQVAGIVDAAQLKLRMSSGGETTEETVPVAEPIYLPSAARARLRGVPLRQGQRVEMRVFDPSAMQHAPMQITVAGRETISDGDWDVQTWKVVESFRGIESTVWLDDAGRMVRERGPMGLEVRRETADQAVGGGWSGPPVDLMGAVGIAVPKPILAPRDLGRLRARIGGLGSITPPIDARQRMVGDTLQVERESLPADTYTLPYAGTEWRGELVATPFLQIGHPTVQAAAREAAGDASDAGTAAVRLRRWVRDNLAQRPAATIPNAVQVLQTRAGDCNEHAVLYAALARAVGLPARVVAGVVYVDGTFLYHAWNEVWLGERWVSVDPAFDQMPADATHIKLVEGGPETHAVLMPLIGNVSIEPLDDAEVG